MEKSVDSLSGQSLCLLRLAIMSSKKEVGVANMWGDGIRENGWNQGKWVDSGSFSRSKF